MRDRSPLRLAGTGFLDISSGEQFEAQLPVYNAVGPVFGNFESSRGPAARCMRILDLGCGPGRDLAWYGVTASDEIIGVDISYRSLAAAKERFPERSYLQGVGECLPLANESFDCVISGVALPYMDIPQALGEIHRVLVPGGNLLVTLHLPGFTVAELLHKALPKPIPTIFRLYVMANGLWFHGTGRTIGFLRGRTESFQTERGMRVALARAGFVNPSFKKAPGHAGETFTVQAEKARGRNENSAMKRQFFN